MKKLAFGMLLLLPIALAGCNEGTPGGPGVTTTTDSTSSDMTADTTYSDAAATTDSSAATDSAATDSAATDAAAPATGDAAASADKSASDGVGDPDNTFRLDLPNLATSIKQGETQVVTIGISRENNFDQDVNLEFVDLPAGVTIDPESPVLKKGDEDAKINVTAAADAALGDHTVKVMGKPASGATATNELKLTIEKP